MLYVTPKRRGRSQCSRKCCIDSMLRLKVFFAKYFHLLLQPIGFGPLHGSYTADAVFVLYIRNRAYSAALFPTSMVAY